MMGKGAIYASSTNQKLNTQSSAEAEIVGVNGMMPQVLWTRYFMEAQGYKVSDNIAYQDNESAMQLEKNGEKSISKPTRHIDIRYFFVTNRIQSGAARQGIPDVQGSDTEPEEPTATRNPPNHRKTIIRCQKVIIKWHDIAGVC
eukprot:9158273-Ditylum_brightwellii.AAC.4